MKQTELFRMRPEFVHKCGLSCSCSASNSQLKEWVRYLYKLTKYAKVIVDQPIWCSEEKYLSSVDYGSPLPTGVDGWYGVIKHQSGKTEIVGQLSMIGLLIDITWCIEQVIKRA